MRKSSFFLWCCIAAPFLYVASSFAVSSANKSNHVINEVHGTVNSNSTEAKVLNETSGLARAHFTTRDGSVLLWGHEEDKSRLSLIQPNKGGDLIVHEVPLYGGLPVDIEDIATATDRSGNGWIYLADTGNNSSRYPVCLHYKIEGKQCNVIKGELLKSKGHKKFLKSKKACKARGEDWAWIEETVSPKRETPVLWRVQEPKTYSDARRTGLNHSQLLRIQYPQKCGARDCGEFDIPGLEYAKQHYNIEALAVIEEPSGHHTAYFFSKAHEKPLQLSKRKSKGPKRCRMSSAAESDVFRLMQIDQLVVNKVHTLEYITTLDFSRSSELQIKKESRVTAADAYQDKNGNGVLAVKTRRGGFQWRFGETDIVGRGETAQYDIKKILRERKAEKLVVPEKLKKERYIDEKTGKQRLAYEKQESMALISETEAYHMGECVNRSSCRLVYVRNQ